MTKSELMRSSRVFSERWEIKEQIRWEPKLCTPSAFIRQLKKRTEMEIHFSKSGGDSSLVVYMGRYCLM